MEYKLVLDGDGNDGHPQLRDELTEGYNPIPNFSLVQEFRIDEVAEPDSCRLMIRN